MSAKYTDGSVITTDMIPDLHLNGDSQCFPLYYYDEQATNQVSLFDEPGSSQYVRRDGVSDFILKRARTQYGKNVTKEDVFYYVYGVLHSSDYRERFANDLKRMLPRLPLVTDRNDFWAFSDAGRKLAELHINYEDVPAYRGSVWMVPEVGNYRVEKMRFRRVRVVEDGKTKTVDDKSTIHYNSAIKISNIPDRAYQYVVNGRSAIEWIMDRYQIRTDKKSGITNDPNDWAKEVGNPRYILDLLLSVINVSVQTVDIVDNLPKLKFD